MKDCPVCAYQNADDAKVCEACGTRFDTEIGVQETDLYQAETRAFAPGNVIADRYTVLRELGRGGMGVVYLVEDTELNSLNVALKIIHPHLVANEEATKRFVEEVITGRKLIHGSIVNVYELHRSGDQRFFTMEYIEGRSLREWLNLRKSNTPPFSLSETVEVIRPLLEALSYAHQHTIHRDIKPENIMVIGDFPEVRIKVLDFGIAKTLSPSRFTQTAQALGTAYYMAPEQMTGSSDVDHRADLYSVGMIVYEMLTGEAAVGRFRLPGELVEGLPKELDELVEITLAPRPAERFESAGNMSETLSAIMERAQVLETKRSAEPASLIASGKKALASAHLEEAEDLVRQVLTLDSGNEEALGIREQVKAARNAVERTIGESRHAESVGDLEEALSLLHEAAGQNRDDPRPAEGIARVEQAVRREEDNKEAEEGRRKLGERKRDEEERHRREQVEREKPGIAEDEPIDVRLEPTRVATPIASQARIVRNSLGMEFVYIEPGTFVMGSPDYDIGRGDDERRHEVTLTSGFYMQATQVTQGQWTQVMKTNPSHFRDHGDSLPVETVSWEDTQEFIAKLVQLEDGRRYQLPSEAQWEYAARAGSTSIYSFGDLSEDLDNYAWFESNSDGMTHAVGGKRPNPWGLYDMHGNVFEWVRDWYIEYPDEHVIDPAGASDGSFRVFRGGSWFSEPKETRSASRYVDQPNFRNDGVGFRLLMEASALNTGNMEDLGMREETTFTGEVLGRTIGESRQAEAARQRKELEQPKKVQDGAPPRERGEGRTATWSAFWIILTLGAVVGCFVYWATSLMPGKLYVSVDPPEAQVMILSIMKPYRYGMELKPGRYRLEVSREGYVTGRRTVEVRAGKRRSVSIVLERKKPSRANRRLSRGTLHVDTYPENARVRIMNIAPRFRQGMELGAGRYRVEVSADGHQRKSLWISLSAGEDKRLQVRLQPDLHSSVTLVEGLIAYYPLDGSAIDGSGNGHNGTVYGASTSRDRLGNGGGAYRFDGVNDYIDTNDLVPQWGSPQSDFTFAAWVKSPGNRTGGIVGASSTPGGNMTNLRLTLNGGKAAHWSIRSSAGDFASVTSEAIYGDNVWHLLVGVKKGATIKLFVDGRLVGAKLAAFRGHFKPKYRFLLGAVFQDSDRNPIQHYQGSIDDVRIYDRALTDAELLSLYSVSEP